MMYPFTMALPLIALAAVLAHSVRFNMEQQSSIPMAAHPSATLIVTNFLTRQRQLKSQLSQTRVPQQNHERKEVRCAR